MAELYIVNSATQEKKRGGERERERERENLKSIGPPDVAFFLLLYIRPARRPSAAFVSRSSPTQGKYTTRQSNKLNDFFLLNGSAVKFHPFTTVSCAGTGKSLKFVHFQFVVKLILVLVCL